MLGTARRVCSAHVNQIDRLINPQLPRDEFGEEGRS